MMNEAAVVEIDGTYESESIIGHYQLFVNKARQILKYPDSCTYQIRVGAFCHYLDYFLIRHAGRYYPDVNAPLRRASQSLGYIIIDDKIGRAYI